MFIEIFIEFGILIIAFICFGLILYRSLGPIAILLLIILGWKKQILPTKNWEKPLTKILDKFGKPY
jgi:hypothetical protein